jgi:hypothetical protein
MASPDDKTFRIHHGTDEALLTHIMHLLDRTFDYDRPLKVSQMFNDTIDITLMNLETSNRAKAMSTARIYSDGGFVPPPPPGLPP